MLAPKEWPGCLSLLSKAELVQETLLEAEQLRGAVHAKLWMQRLLAGASFVSTAQLGASSMPRTEKMNVSYFVITQSLPSLDCCSAYGSQGPRGIRSNIVRAHLPRLDCCWGRAVSIQEPATLAHVVPEQRAAGVVSEGLRRGICFPFSMDLAKLAAFMSSVPAPERHWDYRTDIKSQNHCQNLK